MRRSRHARRGYICIWGTTSKETVTDAEGVEIECPGCHEQTRMIGKAMRPYCSVFYIPLFPEGAGEPFIECTQCGGKFQGDVAAIREAQQNRKAELDAALQEKMRRHEANPGDLDLSCEIVELLAASDRDAEALKLALYLVESNPRNVNVHVLLGRVYLSQDRPAQAIQAFQKAIECSPTHAGALYYCAVAWVNTKPPHCEEALALAKKARDLGHPQARELIQAIEQVEK